MRDERGHDEAAPLRTDRQRVIDALCDAYAADAIEMDELERRLDVAARAGSGAELAKLLDGIAMKPVAPVPSAERRPSGERTAHPAREGAEVPGTRVGWGRTDPERMPERQFHFALWSGRSRKGSWIPARQITAFACMGGVELDFREALFGDQVVEVFASALMGGVEIIVPPGVHVEASGFALLGGFEDESAARREARPDGPTLRITGFAIMGGVEISVRYPGENARDARRRLKEERRRRLESGEGRRGV